MRIIGINNQNQNTFKSFERTVYKAGRCALEENVLHKNNTWAFRSDINWLDLAKFAVEKYEGIEKIKTFFYACSDGREPQSFLIALDAIFGEKAVEKFCPIIARDYDLFVINKAKSNFYDFSEEEVYRINYITGNRFNEYYEPVPKIDNRYKATKKLTDRIIYEVGDFTKEYEDLPKENVFLSVRNCWPYFSMNNQYNLPCKVCNHFDKNATIVIGKFDLTTQESFDFLKNGFKFADNDLFTTVFAK